MVNVEKEKMNDKKESQWWWFDCHTISNSSPWLQSTLSELNEKTKTMMKLVEDDADSFAKRAEMYYKKRPELISLVEDFYRAHRSLAERFDQLKNGRSVHVKSPLRHLLSPSKDENENGFDFTSSAKSFDSFMDTTYSSDESAESEVDDPELEDDSQIDQVEEKKENSYLDLSGNYEVIKMREELDRLSEETEIQRNQIKDCYQEKEKLANQLADSVSELKKLREEFEAIKEENVSFEEVKTVKCDVKSLKLYDINRIEGKPIEEEKVEFKMWFEAEKKPEMTRLWDAMQSLDLERMKKREFAKHELIKVEVENKYLKEALTEKEMLLKNEEEEKRKLMRQFEEAKIELEKIKEETLTKNMCTMEQFDRGEGVNEEVNTQLEKMTKELMELREESQTKDQSFIEALGEKDEEKRAVIRQLSLAMEILREDNTILKKAIGKESSKKRNPAQFQMFKGIQISNWFNSSLGCNVSTL